LVRRDDERRPAPPLDDVGDRERLAASGDAEKRLRRDAGLEAAEQRLDSLRLVPLGNEIRAQLERRRHLDRRIVDQRRRPFKARSEMIRRAAGERRLPASTVHPNRMPTEFTPGPERSEVAGPPSLRACDRASLAANGTAVVGLVRLRAAGPPSLRACD